MFNVGGGELMLIALVAVLVLGPDKLPDFARKSARVVGQLRAMSQGFQNEMKSVINVDEMKDLMNEGTGTTQGTRGPRLVGPIDEGQGPVDTPSSAAATPDGPPSGPDPESSAPPPGPDSGGDADSSGSSAA